MLLEDVLKEFLFHLETKNYSIRTTKGYLILSRRRITDLQKRWNYVCFLIDLFNSEIVGWSAGAQKDAALVQCAFDSVKYP